MRAEDADDAEDAPAPRDSREPASGIADASVARSIDRPGTPQRSAAAADAEPAGAGTPSGSPGLRFQLTPAQIQDIEMHACPPTPGGRGRSGPRMFVGPSAHEWMERELRNWQIEVGASQLVCPRGNEWYRWKRVELIKIILLSRSHSDDVVKSYIKSYIRKLERAPLGR